MKTLFTLSILFVANFCFAQNFHRCGTVEAIQFKENENPGYQEAVNRTFDQAKQLLTQNRADAPDPIYQIPVVVHIIYNTVEENLSDALVQSQIARLNRDYRRLNADTSDTRAEFLPVAADAGIEFFLAGEDPDGNPTNGITRTQTTRTDFAIDPFGNAMDDMKQSSLEGVDAWDTDRYLNIWVCDLIGDNSLFQILGFAYPPASAPNWPANSSASSPEFEGVVIHFQVFGENNPLATGTFSVADKGRTPVHEVGHFLGLRHIWGDVLFGDGCTEDDGLEDTPNASANAAQVCNYANNTCTDSPTDFPDMIENYMDYAQEDCMNLFTEDQVGIMRSMLETARAGLIANEIEPSGISDAIDESEIALFPNPSNGTFQVNIPENLKLNSAVLVDVAGRNIASYNNLSNSSNINVDVDLVPGVYFLQMDFEEGLVNKRVSIY